MGPSPKVLRLNITVIKDNPRVLWEALQLTKFVLNAIGVPIGPGIESSQVISVEYFYVLAEQTTQHV
jgi:hypothetical protein